MLKKCKILFIILMFLFLNACTTKENMHSLSNKIDYIIKTPKIKKPIIKIDKIKLLELSNQGNYLYSILMSKNKKKRIYLKKDKETSKYNEKTTVHDYDTNKYELIKIYTKGAYPAYKPNSNEQPENTLFRDTTFNDILVNIKKEDVVTSESTLFDKKTFIKIATTAIKWVEESTKFRVQLKIKESINTEYTKATLFIAHKPSLIIKKIEFVINGSFLYADLDSEMDLNSMLKKQVYKLGLPSGKNRIKVLVTAETKVTTEDNANVVSTFKLKPTLHMVAIGINEFPKLPSSTTLVNPINDAALVKEIFTKGGAKLFDNNILIKPYTLGYKQTTKNNIEKLIKAFRKNVKPNDYFILYIASHGLKDHNNKFYVAPSDFNFRYNKNRKIEILNNSGIGEDQISEYLLNIPTIFRMVILDTCYAGKQINSIKPLLRTISIGKREGVSVLTAAKNTQRANDNYRGHGLFTYVLGKGLQGDADYNNDKVVDSIEIAQYVIKNVSQISQRERMEQQDAVVFPNPTLSFNRRFELTLVDENTFIDFQPNIFTPKESELYINAINRQDSHLMDGIIRNNQRHKENNTQLIPDNKLSKNEVINKLSIYESIDINIHFETNKATLNNKEIKKLEIIANALNSNKLIKKRILLEGHTDADGADLYNMDLSQKRAHSVAQLLKTKFNIDSSRLNALGFGEIYPVADNTTMTGKAKNRRVSIFIYK